MTASIQTIESVGGVAVPAIQLAEMARQALVAEAELTPKPGLVDRRGSGSHTDLSLDQMRCSAASIAPYFACMADTATGRKAGAALRAQLADIGRDAEAAMLCATGGSNAHKGAIWTLGLLVSAYSMHGVCDAQVIGRTAGDLARHPDRARQHAVSHGQMMLKQYGAHGAYGEACAGFPHVTEIGLPALRHARSEDRSETVSRLCALLRIAAQLEDTCVLYRSGRRGLLKVQQGAQQVMRLGGPDTRFGKVALNSLDVELVTHGISPGGSADLLAATLLLDAVEYRQRDVRADESWTEEMHGTLAV